MEIQSEHAGGLRALPRISLRALPRISLTPEEAAASTGFSVRRIFQAIKDEKLTARKAGKATVIEFAELSRWHAPADQATTPITSISGLKPPQPPASSITFFGQ